MFNKRANAIYQLQKDKHTLLEGYITEDLFKKQFLFFDDIMYTHGWWMGLIGNMKVFFIVKDQLNDLDYELTQVIPDPCWQVILKERTLYFIRNNEIFSEYDFLSMLNLICLRDKMTASNDTRDIIRQQRCIDYFVRNNMETEIAMERYFVNNFLSVYFNGMVNVDYFTKNKKGLINVIEIKFKYESKDGCFGINTGQMNMFDYFKKLGFKINHFILYNHTKDMNLSILNFLNLPDQKKWLYTSLDTDNKNVGIAPERTSISGGFKQSYYKINICDINTYIPFERR
jgi:hypothetical protein